MRNKADDSADRLPAPRFAENGYRLPDPLPAGHVLTDATRRQWLLGKSIGCGGFGEIYCAKELPDTRHFHNNGNQSNGAADGDRLTDASHSYNGQPKRRCVRKFAEQQLKNKNKEKLAKLVKDSNYPFVVKVDHLDGPLFAEMHFYHRVAKPKFIDNWMLTHRLAFLGMPRFVASGIHLSTQTCRRYRFLVLDRLGVDLQKILNKQNNRLNMKSAYTIAMMTLDILAYIHSFGYIHADIKASNLLLGRLETESPARELYLVDYGLVEKYRLQNGDHKEEEEDNRRANSGTIEFTSRDGHVGALTRRSDLEILSYNTISWLSGGRLPWMDCKEHETVRKQKVHYMDHIDELLRYAFDSKSNVPKGLEEFVRSVKRLGFKEDPDYDGLKMILHRALVSSGYANDGLITWGEKPVAKNKRNGSKRNGVAASASDRQARGQRKGSKQEMFEQFQMLEIPRKMVDRNRGVRSAPTTTVAQHRQRTGSVSPTTLLDIEWPNPTPQMLEVMARIRQKSGQHNGDLSCDAVDAGFAHLNGSLATAKRRLKALKRSPSKAKKWRPIGTTSSSSKTNARRLKPSVTYQPINDLKSDSKIKKQSKKLPIIRKRVSTSPRIPLQKLEINVKTTTTTQTKRCSSRSSLKRKAKTTKHQMKVKVTPKRNKSKTSVSKVVLKKLSKKNRSAMQRSRVQLVVDLPNGPLRCAVRPIRSAINATKRVIK